MALERSAIDIAAVPDIDYVDNQSIVLDGIDDSVGILPNPVAITPGQLLATRWLRILGQLANSLHDSLPILRVLDRLDRLGSGE